MMRVLLLLFCIMEVIAYRSGHSDTANILSGVTRYGVLSDSSSSTDLPVMLYGGGPGHLSVSSSDTDDKNEFFLIRTGPCYGFCPVYRMQVFSDGKFVYQGYANVRKPGKFHGKFPPEVFAKLLVAVEAFNFNKFVDLEQHECREYVLDHPSVITLIQIGGKQHAIGHNYGCTGFLHEPELIQFESDAARILEISDWPGG